MSMLYLGKTTSVFATLRRAQHFRDGIYGIHEVIMYSRHLPLFNTSYMQLNRKLLVSQDG
jgi:hypothetical protein